jgi:hypothetical protein
MDIAALLAQLLTALAVFTAVITLRANHDHYRREFAAKLIWEWTLNTRPYTKAATNWLTSHEAAMQRHLQYGAVEH